MRKLSETNVLNKTIALRVDLNVPVENDKVLDDTRIIAIIPTLEYLLAHDLWLNSSTCKEYGLVDIII